MPATASVVVSFSSNERIFLDALLTEAVKFAKEVVVSYGSHFFDGTPEDTEWMDSKAQEWLERSGSVVKFICYSVTRDIENNPLTYRPHAYWHNISRIEGVNALDKEVDYVFFVDGDEIAEGDLLNTWLTRTEMSRQTAYMFANYWYFRNPRYQATSIESSILMTPYSWVSSNEKAYNILMKNGERQEVEGVITGVVMSPNRPMFHHFSWVRSKSELLRKVATWGHKGDKDWSALIEKEFSGEFEGRDFVHGYEYKIVSNRWNITV